MMRPATCIDGRRLQIDDLNINAFFKSVSKTDFLASHQLIDR